MPGLLSGPDGKPRCWWCGETPDYVHYHDHEWGFPVHDDQRLFEKLCLEGFQSGLSWLTILRKREGFRRCFGGFDVKNVSKMTDSDVEKLLQDASIVRHRGKIQSTINNANRALELIAEFGSLANYVWRYEPPRRLPATIQPTSPESIAMSKDLKKRGWSFVGPTTVYAFMQAMGLVNDHLEGCHAREIAESQRRNAI
jgi:DNA-3-methyladenine glycosylase I